MRFRVHDGACDALLPGAVGTLAGHPLSPHACACGHADCPNPTPEPPPRAEGDDDGDTEAVDAPVGLLWLAFAEDQLTEAKRAQRGTLPVPEPEPVVCATCDGSLVIHLAAQRNENRLVVDVPELPEGATAVTIPHGMAIEATDGPAYYPPPAEPLDLSQPITLAEGQPVAFTNAGDDDDTAEFEVDPEGEGSDYADDYEPEPLVPELIEVQCPACRGTGWAPPPPPPMIPRNPSPFRAGVRADQAECVVDTGSWDGPLTALPGGTGIGASCA